MRTLLAVVSIVMILLAGLLVFAAVNEENIGWQIAAKNPYLFEAVASAKETARTMRWVAFGFGALGLLMLTILAAPRRPARVDDEERIPCPYCAEDIKPEAIKCPHCRTTL